MLVALTAFASIAWMGLLAYWFVGNQFKANGYEPVDYDAVQKELDDEFAPVSVERAARLQ